MEEYPPDRRPERLLTHELSPLEFALYSAWGLATLAAVAAFAEELGRLRLVGEGCANGLYIFGFFAAALCMSWGIVLIAHLCGE